MDPYDQNSSWSHVHRRLSMDSLCDEVAPAYELNSHLARSPVQPHSPPGYEQTTKRKNIMNRLSLGSIYKPLDLGDASMKDAHGASALDPTQPFEFKRGAKPRHFTDDWTWEIVSISFSFLCFVAIVALAAKLEGRLLSAWNFILQPSTVISILVAAAQSSMMLVISGVIGQLKWIAMTQPTTNSLADLEIFDAASRGPTGSIGLFYRWRGHGTMFLPTYLAAFVTISALAMGPFALQIVSIHEEMSRNSGLESANIPITNHYSYDYGINPGAQIELSDSGHVGFSRTGGGLVVETSLKGAFYNGMYALNGHVLNFECGSGNCTWLPFRTLGMCSVCQDISDAIKVNISNYAQGTSTMTTPRGKSLAWSMTKKVQTFLTSFADGQGTLESLSPLVLSMVVGQFQQNNPGNPAGATVTECQVFYCSQQYEGLQVTSGVLQSGYERTDMPLLPVKNQSFHHMEPGSSTKDNWPFLMTTNSDGHASPNLPLANQTDFNVGIRDYFAVTDFLLSQLDISAEDDTSYFSKGQDVIGTMENITSAISARFPVTISPDPTRNDAPTFAVGVSSQLHPVIRIQFAWLSLPGLLIVAASCLLLLTILTTRRTHTPVWKSSLFPVLFHGFRGWGEHEERDLLDGRLEKVKAMEKMAAGQRVQLYVSKAGGSWLMR